MKILEQHQRCKSYRILNNIEQYHKKYKLISEHFHFYFYFPWIVE